MKSRITSILLTIGSIFSMQAAVQTIFVGQGGGFTFSPSILSVSVGDTIKFSWVSGVHTSTSVSVPSGADTWSSAITENVTSFEYVVKQAGEYHYKCNPHGSAFGMTGKFLAVVTGIKDRFTTIKNSFTISPNPAIEQANLNFSSDTDFRGFVRIFDASGIMVKEEKIKVEAGENNLSINTSKLLAGLYYLNLFDKNDSFLAQKFIKQ